MALLLIASSVWMACRGTNSSPSNDRGYWTMSCVSGNGRYLLAGGDHGALVDLTSGTIVERVPGMVKAVGCEESGGVVVGYGTAVRLPGKTPVTPVPALPGDPVIARTPTGDWVSGGRKSVSSQWRGPAVLSVLEKGRSTRRMELLPQHFGPVGAARVLPTPDTFAVRFGHLLEDGRLLVGAGWQPTQSAGELAKIPWGFFAIDLRTGAASPLTPRLRSNAAVNQAWLQKVAATTDGAHLVVAAHDGRKVAIARFARGAKAPGPTAALDALGSPTALAVSANGEYVALGTETRGRDALARAWILDGQNRPVWTSEFAKSGAGLHFLSPRTLIVAAGEAKAIKVELPAGTTVWTAQ